MACPAPHIGEFAIVRPWVAWGNGCIVREFAMVGRVPSDHGALARRPSAVQRIKIGHRVDIGVRAVIFADVEIGDECLIGDSASIREGARIGNRCIIGRNVTVNYDAVLADDVKLQDGTHITGGCIIGAGTFVGVNVTTANDRRREIVDYKFAPVTPPIIGAGCLIGSGACIVPGVRIGDGAIIGAGALVTKDVPAGATVLGTPAQMRGSMAEVMRYQMAQAKAQADLNAAMEEHQHRWARA